MTDYENIGGLREMLRTAVRQLREVADATTSGRWVIGWHRDGYPVAIDSNNGYDDVVHGDHVEITDADARYIAGMDPPVALAVANWLETEADNGDLPSAGALAVAVTYLRVEHD